MLVLKKPFDVLWKNKDPFEEVEKISGKVYRSVATRSTLNFHVGGESFYLKLHHGITYKEFFKNVLTFHVPVMGARNEYQATRKLSQLGVDTMECVAFGEKGINPIKRTSFIITRDLSPTISLEDFCKNWASQPPSYSVKRFLITKVADIVRAMHEGGVNHRDCYICHFLLHLPFVMNNSCKISVIDLHRAQIRSQVPLRWRNKDLIELYYSTLTIGLNTRDYLRFLKVYFRGKKLRQIFDEEAKLLNTVEKKAEKIRERSVRRGL